jgi:hypothetical protein
MEQLLRSFSRRSLLITFFFLALPLLSSAAAFYWLLRALPGELALQPQAGADLSAMIGWIDTFVMRLREVERFFIPASIALFGIAGFGLWGCLRLVLARLLNKPRPARPPARDRAPVSAVRSAEEAHQARLYLHLLCGLQREGRLVDFLCEDLSGYGNEQIGAAVRGIQESCQRMLQQNLAPKPVLEEEEGSRYTVPPGFDTAAIKLSGQVAGEPPFKGIIRHRGWRAGQLEIPTITAAADPRLIAPAEVEIDSP